MLQDGGAAEPCAFYRCWFYRSCSQLQVKPEACFNLLLSGTSSCAPCARTRGRFLSVHLPLSAACNLPWDLLVAVPVLIDITALRHPALLVQGKRELQLQREGEGSEERERKKKKKQGFRLCSQSSQQLRARLVGES